MGDLIKMGAVLYDPRVSVIWEIIRDFFDANNCPIDVNFYKNYAIQVDDLLNGKIDIAWNSPLAWLDAQRKSGENCRAIAMRDTDRDRVSYIVVRKNGCIKNLTDLKNEKLAFGAKDSPQATLIPIGFLHQNGLRPNQDYELVQCDVLLGKHGDHIGGELEGFRCLQNEKVVATAMLDLNWESWIRDGTLDPSQYSILATTSKFDHCVFSVSKDFSEDREQHWLSILFSMSYANQNHREMMDLEGLKEWLPGRTTGFQPLRKAIKIQKFFKETNK